MTQARDDAVAILISDDQWWVTGGFYSGYMDSTEIYTASVNAFANSTVLPTELGFHNVVKVNETFAVVFGGYNNYYSVYYYDLNTLTWSNGPSLPMPRSYCFGGLYTFENGTSVVVAAGGVNLRSSTVLNLESGIWQDGPDLPNIIQRGASVPIGLKTFLVVAGINSNNVYELDLENDMWIQKTSLVSDRSEFPAFFVPEEYCIDI